ncbi:hypothetical protein RJZ90_007265, partial [Blastomyces dermatitidis]
WLGVVGRFYILYLKSLVWKPFDPPPASYFLGGVRWSMKNRLIDSEYEWKLRDADALGKPMHKYQNNYARPGTYVYSGLQMMSLK